jgi:translocation and assembly module TamB
VKLADPVYVRGPQANMTWRGSVEVERSAGEEIRATGAVVADRGRVNFLGRDFIVDSGRVTLPEQGDLDPYIALTAVTQTEEGAVTIDVHGRASRPELRLSSDPPLPESDVFALLVTGSSGGADKEGEGGAVEAKAASLLAAFQNPVLQRELQDRVGIDRVGVSFGDTIDQPIVAVGKRVSRKIYLETRYHHNAPEFENNAEVHLEYSIKPPAWTVETFIGDAAKGGVEVWWRKRFGRPREPKQ